VKDPAQTRARKDDVCWAATQPKVITSNCLCLSDWATEMFPGAKAHHRDAIAPRLAVCETMRNPSTATPSHRAAERISCRTSGVPTLLPASRKKSWKCWRLRGCGWIRLKQSGWKWCVLRACGVALKSGGHKTAWEPLRLHFGRPPTPKKRRHQIQPQGSSCCFKSPLPKGSHEP